MHLLLHSSLSHSFSQTLLPAPSIRFSANLSICFCIIQPVGIINLSYLNLILTLTAHGPLPLLSEVDAHAEYGRESTAAEWRGLHREGYRWRQKVDMALIERDRIVSIDLVKVGRDCGCMWFNSVAMKRCSLDCSRSCSIKFLDAYLSPFMGTLSVCVCVCLSVYPVSSQPSISYHNDMVWYGIVWDGMGWDGMVWDGIAKMRAE